MPFTKVVIMQCKERFSNGYTPNTSPLGLMIKVTPISFIQKYIYLFQSFINFFIVSLFEHKMLDLYLYKKI